MSITEDDIHFPIDDRQSRINRPPRAETPDDVIRAADRIEAFWEKHPDGSILPEVEIETLADADGIPYRSYTARAYVRKDASSERADVVAHATRSERDEDEYVRRYAQETAETSAISRAIRNLGILATAPKPNEPDEQTATLEPQTDAAIGRDVMGAREAAGLSQADLAAAMAERGFRWSQATVYNVEKGKRPLRFNESQHLRELIRLGLST
ncbi:helix-turn-helix domain-containing protein [Microbacterium sp. NPDC008134]|uniref:helix-turn-helix domain-containing protein n=1 Tax=Microbacterium sp. NPDC008134 TaxID=3364183 RepID=UPI0036EA9269